MPDLDKIRKSATLRTVHHTTTSSNGKLSASCNPVFLTALSLWKPAWCCLLAACACACASVEGADWPQWRGPERNGISQEKGLLREWPKEGPRLAWKTSDAGMGYGAPSVVGDRLFLMGNEGIDQEFVRALSAHDGKVIWTTEVGKVGSPQQKPNFPGARSTPTVVQDAVYVLSSDGDLVCLEAANGKVRWRKNVKVDFGGKMGQWAYAESPLVDGDLIVCTPGGTNATMLALHRLTGELAWKGLTPEGDEAGYASVVPVEMGGVRQYVQSMQKGLAGFDAKSGRMLWRYPKSVSRYGANIPTPLVAGDVVYASASGTGGGAVRLKAEQGVVKADELYFEAKLPTSIGGAVKVGDSLFGTTAQALQCAEFGTGKLRWEDRSVGAASILAADGLLFLHAESGDVALVDASPEGYREKGRFRPADAPARRGPMEKAWAYPVLADGKLYVREHGTVWCYAVR